MKDNDLLPILKQLKGEVEVKPFECVGTIEEVNACLAVGGQQTTDNRQQTLDILLSQYDEMNNLPEQFEAILKDNLFKNN